MHFPWEFGLPFQQCYIPEATAAILIKEKKRGISNVPRLLKCSFSSASDEFWCLFPGDSWKHPQWSFVGIAVSLLTGLLELKRPGSFMVSPSRDAHLKTKHLNLVMFKIHLSNLWFLLYC